MHITNYRPVFKLAIFFEGARIAEDTKPLAEESLGQSEVPQPLVQVVSGAVAAETSGQT